MGEMKICRHCGNEIKIDAKKCKYCKKELDIPIVSKITREKDPMLEFELTTTKIYDLIYNEELIKKEYQNHLYKEDLWLSKRNKDN